MVLSTNIVTEASYKIVRNNTKVWAQLHDIKHPMGNENPSLYPYGNTHPYPARVGIAVFLIVITIIGIVGNGIVLALIIHRRRLHTPSNLFMANLSVVGLLSHVLGTPNYIANIISGKHVFSDNVCKAFSYWNYVLTLALLINSTVIALHRFVILKTPRIIRINKKHIYVIVIMWIVPLLTALFGIPFFGYNQNQLYCIFKSEHNGNQYFPLLIALPAVVALAVTFICYFLICCQLKASHNRLTPQSTRHNIFTITNPENQTRDLVLESASNTPETKRRNAWGTRSERDVKVTLHLVVVYTVFCVFWAPLCILYLSHNAENKIHPTIWLACSAIARSYTAIFWILNLGFNHSLRTALVQVFKSCRSTRAGIR